MGILLLAACIHLGLFSLITLGWFRISPKSRNSGKQRPLSVIIAARNEAENLEEFLPHVLSQEYGKYEVIVVLNGTTDDSEAVLEELSLKYGRLRFFHADPIPEGWPPKKYALDVAIKKARYEQLVFTDADCRPGKRWLAEIDENIGEHDHALVIGTSPYFLGKGFLNRFIQFETSYTAFQYIGLNKLGLTYMAVGRNISYPKSFYTDAGGHATGKAYLSGDDDLLVNRHAEKVKTIAMVSESSKVHSLPSEDWHHWFWQKRRHVSASGGYSWKSKLFLTLFHGSHVIFYLTLPIAMLFSGMREFALLIYLVKLLFTWVMLRYMHHKWRTTGWLFLYPIMDLLHFFYNLIVVPLGLFSRPSWQKRNE